jgi:serine/threonine protein kinase
VGAPSLQPGMTIAGKYKLSRLIGQGGMGSVFVAENTLTGKQVAIKCLHRQFAGTPEAGQRFLREAKASARIRHPNVVDIYDVLSENDTFYLVMEFLEGESLAAYLSRETTPLPQLIKYLVGAMRGVAAAHREGVIHRDIKPENIFLAREGYDHQIVPKVLDFGISKVQGTQDANFTNPGTMLGTVAYMSMEQLAGAADIDGRADVYAFGVILYQAITGQAPFEAETYPALILRIMTEQPVPLKQLRPDVPNALCALVESAMAKQRDARMRSIEQFIAELEPYADDSSFERKTVLTSKLPPSKRAPRVTATIATPPSVMSEPHVAEPRTSAVAHTAAQRLLLSSQPTQLATESPFLASSAPPKPPRRGLVHPGVLGLVFVATGCVLWWWLQPMAAETAGRGLDRPVVVPASGQTPTAADDGPAQLTAEQVRAQAAAALGTVRAAETLKPAPPELPPAIAPNGAELPRRTEAPARLPRATAAPDPSDDELRPGATTGVPAVKAARRARLRNIEPPAAANKAARPGCNPNFIFDAQGEKHFKPECF